MMSRKVSARAVGQGAHGQQRLRFLQAHPRAQPAVELEQHRLAHRRVALVCKPGIEPFKVGQVCDRLDRGFGDHPRLARGQLPVIALEGADHDRRQVFRCHPLGKRPKVRFHASHLKLQSSAHHLLQRSIFALHRQLRLPQMPVRRLLVGERRRQQPLFLECAGNQLQAHRQPLAVEPARHRHAADPRQVQR